MVSREQRAIRQSANYTLRKRALSSNGPPFIQVLRGFFSYFEGVYCVTPLFFLHGDSGHFSHVWSPECLVPILLRPKLVFLSFFSSLFRGRRLLGVAIDDRISCMDSFFPFPSHDHTQGPESLGGWKAWDPLFFFDFPFFFLTPSSLSHPPVERFCRREFFFFLDSAGRAGAGWSFPGVSFFLSSSCALDGFFFLWSSSNPTVNGRLSFP